jgi:hypothetical protein
MDKFVQNIFLILLPFYPFWAYLFYSITKKPASIFVVLMLIPLAFYSLLTKRIRIPKYLIFLILFTIYHLSSIFINNIFPAGTNKIFFLLSDTNVFACLLFIVIESISFDDGFITKMNRLIFILVIITSIFSIIQIKYPSFFVNPDITDNPDVMLYLGDRSFSIFSWINMNSLGISFPILISILLSVPNFNKKNNSIIILIGIIVSFLTKARYVMMSAIIVLSQLFINSEIALRKRVYSIVLIVGLVFVSAGVATFYGFNIQQVIDNRILEKETGMGSARARVTSYEVFMIKFPEHPWFGVGPQTRDDVLRLLDGVAPLIHIGYLSYLYYYGVVGCLLLALAIFYLLKDGWFIGKKFGFWGSFYGLLSFCFANLTFVYFDLSEIGIVLAVIYLKYFSEKSITELAEKK